MPGCIASFRGRAFSEVTIGVGGELTQSRRPWIKPYGCVGASSIEARPRRRLFHRFVHEAVGVERFRIARIGDVALPQGVHARLPEARHVA
jgi:hypothetical protein